MATADRTTQQLLLRVPRELHRRLAMQATREGRSMNAIANDALQATVPAGPPAPAEEELDPAARRARLRARLKEVGMLGNPPRLTDGPPLTDEEFKATWDRLVEASRGIGPVLEEEIRADRERV